jgi:tRNA1(Val) A37 N6-methylase TrmN6
LKKLINNIRQKGLLNSLKIFINILESRLFDIRYNTDTHKRVLFRDLNIQKTSIEHRISYDPSPISPFLKLIKKLKPTDSDVFIDIGSGKGRILLLASTLGFRLVVGIEFSEELFNISKRNILNYTRKRKCVPKIEVQNIDALKYKFTNETFIFLFNPFDQEIMEVVISNLINSYYSNPRNICIIYNNPVHKLVIEQFGFFKQSSRYLFGGREFQIFQKKQE